MLSQVDKTVMTETEQTLTLNGKSRNYEVQLPWNENKEKLVNYESMAEKILISTQRNLEKVPKEISAYIETLKTYENKGYKEQVDLNEDGETKWLLPHFSGG